MLRSSPSWELAERAPTRVDEVVRKLQRRWRRVPDLAALRALGMKIGDNVAAMNGVHLDPGRPWLLTIGDDVTFSLDVIVLTHDASMLRHTGYAKIAPVTIGSRVFVGAHAIILPGVEVGDDVVIAAGAVVTKDVAPRSVVAGVPARVVSSLDEWTRAHRAAAAVVPVWSTSDLPVGASMPIKEQRRVLARLGGRRFGYIGAPRGEEDLAAEEVSPPSA